MFLTIRVSRLPSLQQTCQYCLGKLKLLPECILSWSQQQSSKQWVGKIFPFQNFLMVCLNYFKPNKSLSEITKVLFQLVPNRWPTKLNSTALTWQHFSSLVSRRAFKWIGSRVVPWVRFESLLNISSLNFWKLKPVSQLTCKFHIWSTTLLSSF